MIQSKQELINLLPIIYSSLNLPIYLLDQNFEIITSTKEFMQLNNDYFKSFLDIHSINNYKVYTAFHQHAAFFIIKTSLEDIGYICIGPIFTRKLTKQDRPSELEFLKSVISTYSFDDFLHLPYVTPKLPEYITLIYQLLTETKLETYELKLNFQSHSLPPLKDDTTLNKELFEIRENPAHTFSYSYEQKIINYIQNENSTAARMIMNELLQFKDGRQLSFDQIRSIKYKLVAAIAIFTRSVIEVGVPIAQAYTLSDIYIEKLDILSSVDELLKMIADIIVDFTSLVKKYKHIKSPYWVTKCKNYISHNLHIISISLSH